MHTQKTFNFLEGGGSMGEYIRTFDWAHSPLGAIKLSPQSLEDIRKPHAGGIGSTKNYLFWQVSHEFRTPLTLMLGQLENLLARRQQEASLEDCAELEVVHRNSLRLLKLVNTLLDFSRIEAGRAQAIYVETDLAALTADLASVFRAAIEKA